MNIEQIIALREKIQNLVDAHPKELKELFQSCDSSVLDSADKIRKEYQQKVNPDRQLHIGIVGRVKAGKSSLLNSLLFDGKDVLPKAATPMTAALTKLYYSDKLTVKINFFEQSDIEELKKKSVDYERILKSKTEDIFNKQVELFVKKNKTEPNSSEKDELRKKAERLAVNDLRENNLILTGAAEQYRMFIQAPQDVKDHLGKPIEINPDNMSDIADQLGNYVGSNGKYTAITSNVEIGFPNDQLKDITVVDTPGFDDPVPSRDTLAREALKVCDAIFVLSPSGSFCNDQDRSNIAKIEKGEGIQEVYVIASRIDDDLGNEFFDGEDIKQELDKIVDSISGTLKRMLENMRNRNDVSVDLIDKLSDSTGTNLLYTSGMCQSLYENWDNRKNWCDEQSDVWNRLVETYPDLFAAEDECAREFLRIIGNVDSVRSKIQEVSKSKEVILSKRETEFITAKFNSVKEIINTLSNGIDSLKSDVENADLATLIEAQKKQSENLNNLRSDFIDVFDECIGVFVDNAKDNLNEIIKGAYNDSKSGIESSQGTTEKEIVTKHTRIESKRVKDSGIGGWWDRLWGSGDDGYHYVERKVPYETVDIINVETVNCHKVCSSINDFSMDISNILNDYVIHLKRQLKVSLKGLLLDVWGKYEVTDYCSSGARSAQAGAIINNMPDVRFDIAWELPFNMQKGGNLEGEEAESFNHIANDALKDLRRTCENEIRDYCEKIKNSFVPSEMANLVLDKMQKQIEDMEDKVKNKKETLYHLQRVKEDVVNIKNEIDSTI